MPQRKRLETTALFGLVLQLIFLVICFALYYRSDSRAVLAEMWFLAPGVLVWLVVLLHGRQTRLAELEREEAEELRRRRMSEEIFEEQELDRMRAHTGLVIFERYVVPAFSVLLSGLLFYLAYRNVRQTWQIRAMPPIKDARAVAAGMAAITFFGFLLAKYAVGLARSPDFRLLRAAGSYLMGNVVGSLLLVAAMSMAYFEALWLAKAVAYAIPGLMGLIAVEIVLNQVLEIYRPRLPGRERRPAYDSRLLGLFAEPGDVLKTVAATLDYQFGFRISETWFYRFMERAIVPLILIQLLALWLMSCIVVVERGEIAFVERFGRPVVSVADRDRGLKASVLGPGYHLKAPWPIEAAQKVPADKIYGVVVGRLIFARGDVASGTILEGGAVATDENVILWRELHVHPTLGREVDFLVPSVVELEGFKAPALNLARVMGNVHFRIKRNEEGSVDEQAAYDFYYRHTNPSRLVEDLGFRAMCRLAASQNFLEWIHVRRAEVSQQFERMLQEALDDEALTTGIELVYAGIPAVHPPAGTAAAFEDVISAYEESQALKHTAERAAVSMEHMAKAMAAQRVGEASSYAYRLKKLSEAEALRFAVQRSAFLKARSVYRYRKYFSAVEQVLEGHRLFLVPMLKDEVQIIDLQEKLGADILNIDLLGGRVE